MRYLFLLGMCIVLFSNCSKDNFLSPEDQLKKDDGLIQEYLTNHKLTATKTASGLYYIITKQGNGSYPKVTNVVTVNYQGYFTDDKIFDQSTVGSPVTFPLNQVIKGWQEGIPLIRKGGKATLFIPSYLGYADNPPSGIPSNAVLIFDVELLNF